MLRWFHRNRDWESTGELIFLTAVLFLFIPRSFRRRHIYDGWFCEWRSISGSSVFACCASPRSSFGFFEQIQSGQLGNSFSAILPSLCRERHNFFLVSQQNSTKKPDLNFASLLLKEFDKKKREREISIVWFTSQSITLYSKKITEKKNFLS